MAEDEVSPRAYAPILSSGTVNMQFNASECKMWPTELQVNAMFTLH